MTPGTHNFTIYRGASFGPKVFTFTDDTLLVPMALTGLTALAEARENVNGAVKVDLTPVVTNAAAGAVTMEFTVAQTQAMPAGIFYWDFLFEDGAGERTGPYLKGKLTVSALNTQP